MHMGLWERYRCANGFVGEKIVHMGLWGRVLGSPSEILRGDFMCGVVLLTNLSGILFLMHPVSYLYGQDTESVVGFCLAKSF